MRDYLDHAMRDAGRIELRHQIGESWVSGMFDDIGALRMEIRSRIDTGNLYTSINAPHIMLCSNSMHDRALADADIALRTRLVFDFDPIRPKGVPSTDVEMQAAAAARDRMVAALLALGWPLPATALSGNGAHAVYRWRMAVSSESTDMLTFLYRGMKDEFSTAEVEFDPTVRNPARIWRLYGSINRKGSVTPDRPHRKALVRIPALWEAVSPKQVERMASKFALHPAPQQQAHRPAIRRQGAGDYSTLDIESWIKAHGHYRRHLELDKHAVRCPWEHEHSTVDGDHSTATVVWEANGKLWPNFRCQHAHCEGRGVQDVMSLWGDADVFCARTWRAAS